MAKITVGIPASRTRFLVQAVSSVLTQTFGEFELLISDDTPDGAAGDLVRRFQDPRVRVIEGPRQGAAANHVHLWENASADLFKFLHDDDLLFPEALEELTALINRNPAFTLAAGRRAVIDECGRELRRPMTYQTDDWMWFEPAQVGNHLARNVTNAFGELSSLLIRRSAFEDATCLNRVAGLPITRLLDVALVLNAARRGPCVATGKYLNAIREHADQLSTQSQAPDRSLSLLEWEVCLRAAVELGIATPQNAAEGVKRLASLYRHRNAAYPEVQHFLHHLAPLQQQLLSGDRRALTAQFATDLERAHATVQARAAEPRNEPGAAEPPTASADERIRAHVQMMDRRGARGWAWVPEQRDLRVRVEAVLGDRVIGHTVADLHRADLAAWNVGASDYAFELTFYEPLLSAEAPRFRFFTSEVWGNGEFQLPPFEGAVPERYADAPLREHARFTAPGEHFEDFAAPRGGDTPRRTDGPTPLVAAFYLPQFHAIPENDANWGLGFTEWRQLPRGIPRFPGHYQPRIPRDLGFYNLLDEEVLKRQCDIAQTAGVGAFAFYYYWFNRQRVLEKPIELFLEADVQMPFFLIWANENWTRGWDGSEHQILLRQDYDPADEDALLADLARHMRHPRYVRLQNRPLFVIYNPSHIPDTTRTVQRWRRKWWEAHGLEPLIYMAQTFNREDPRPYELDGAMEFPPHKLGSRLEPREVLDAFSSEFTGRVLSYEALAQASLAEPPPPYPLIKTALPSWDNDARRPNRGLLFEGSTPQKYEAWLQALVMRAMENPVHGQPLVAINAWNEWAEGAYLEPDVHFGAAYLNATRRALDGAIGARNLAGGALARPDPAGEQPG